MIDIITKIYLDPIFNIVIKICSAFLYLLCYTKIKKRSLEDEDFDVSKEDYKKEIFFHMITLLEFVFLPARTCIYAAIGMSILLNSAYTDKKSEKVYLMLIIPVALASFIAVDDIKAIFLLIVFLSVMSLGLKLFGFGDVIMAIPHGIITYSFLSANYPNISSITIVEIELLMFAVTEIFAFVVAKKNHQIEKGFKLKESIPIGPEILCSTHLFIIALIIVTNSPLKNFVTKGILL